MAEEILAYIRKQGANGIRWIDLEKEFCNNRKWSKGKFVNSFKAAKKELKKVEDPKSGRPRYYIKEQYKVLADKAWLRSEIKENNLCEVEIPADRLVQVEDYIMQQLQNAIFLEAAEKAKKQAAQDFPAFLVQLVRAETSEEKELKAILKWIREHVNIRIACSANETPPTLTAEDISSLIKVAVSKITDPNRGAVRKSPFHIIISFPIKEE
jgi:hypothetical protein